MMLPIRKEFTNKALKHKPLNGKRPNQGGQSMIEILASIIIFSVGILGTMGMQSTALSLNKSSYNRAQAIVSANDIIERMRANRNGVVEGYYSGYDSESPPENPGCSAGSYCSDEDWAQYDLFEWSNNFQNVYNETTFKPLLPDGTAEINYHETNLEYEIKVSWNEVDWDPNGSGNRSSQTKSVSMRFSI